MDELNVRIKYRSGMEYRTLGERITWTGIEVGQFSNSDVSIEFVGQVGEGTSRSYATIHMSQSQALALAGVVNSAAQADISRARVDFRDDGVRVPVPGQRSIE